VARESTRLAFIFGLVIVLATLFVKSMGAADPPLPQQPNPDEFQWQGQSLAALNPVHQELLRTGQVRWRYTQGSSCVGNEFANTQAALEAVSRQFGVTMIYDEAGPVHVIGNCGPSFRAICGSGAIGCLGRGYPRNLTIDLDTATMSSWSFNLSRLAVVYHELMHALLTWNEQYNISLFSCIPGWRDFMNCGLDSRHEFEYVETERFKRTAYPDVVQWAALEYDATGPYVYWAQPDKKTTRISILIYDYVTGDYYWSGVIKVLGDGHNSVRVPYLPHVCYDVKAENLVSWYATREIKLAGCTP
jgi:hypothetical protein